VEGPGEEPRARYEMACPLLLRNIEQVKLAPGNLTLHSSDAGW
jgi:hypothetical protein